MDVPSPCIEVCRLDEARVCVGCLRTIEEIAGWPQMSAERKLEVIRRIEALRAAAGNAKA